MTRQADDMPAKNGLAWLWLSLLVLVLDLATKEVVLDRFALGESIRIIPNLLDFTRVHNPGAAFSFLSDASGWQRWFFSALAVGISAMLAWWLHKAPRSDWKQCVPFALVIGGAIGNLIDRLRHGYVVDFIDAYIGQHHWPAFNIADSAIVVGVIFMVVTGFLESRKK